KISIIVPDMDIFSGRFILAFCIVFGNFLFFIQQFYMRVFQPCFICSIAGRFTLFFQVWTLWTSLSSHCCLLVFIPFFLINMQKNILVSFAKSLNFFEFTRKNFYPVCNRPI